MDEVTKLTKRARYIQLCKDVVWRRWTRGYIRALRKRHSQNHGKSTDVTIGEILLIKGDEKDRGIWKIGVVEKLVRGKDGIIRGVKLRTTTGTLERPLQLLHPMEIRVDQRKCVRDSSTVLNPHAEEYKPRSQRRSKMEAICKIEQLIENEQVQNCFFINMRF